MTKPYWVVVLRLFKASWMAVLVVPGLFRALWVVLRLSESLWMGVPGLCALFSLLLSLLFFSLPSLAFSSSLLPSLAFPSSLLLSLAFPSSPLLSLAFPSSQLPSLASHWPSRRCHCRCCGVVVLVIRTLVVLTLLLVVLLFVLLLFVLLFFVLLLFVSLLLLLPFVSLLATVVICMGVDIRALQPCTGDGLCQEVRCTKQSGGA